MGRLNVYKFFAETHIFWCECRQHPGRKGYLAIHNEADFFSIARQITWKTRIHHFKLQSLVKEQRSFALDGGASFGFPL